MHIKNHNKFSNFIKRTLYIILIFKNEAWDIINVSGYKYIFKSSLN